MTGQAVAVGGQGAKTDLPPRCAQRAVTDTCYRERQEDGLVLNLVLMAWR